MKLFGSFKLTDRIRVGASTGGRKKKSSSKGSTGCGLIILALLVICVPISLIKSCVGGDEKETTTEITTVIDETTQEKGIFFNDTSNVELKAGESVKGTFENNSGEKFGRLVFVSSDENVATIELDYGVMSIVNYKIKGIAPGTAVVHVESSDGSFVSEKIVVTVLEGESTEKETTAQSDEETMPTFTGRIVYKTPDGERYHYDRDCAGKNARELHLDEAKYWGYRPCGTCVK